MLDKSEEMARGCTIYERVIGDLLVAINLELGVQNSSAKQGGSDRVKKID